MQIIKHSVEFWPQGADWHDQVARCARLCYASASSARTSEELCRSLRNKGHNSMFRHGTKYFIARYADGSKMQPKIFSRIMGAPYISMVYFGSKKSITYYISANMQYLNETPLVAEALAPHEVSLDEFVAESMKTRKPKILDLVRYTICATTQIGTSRELNRTSPNNISEQSTRYVNFGKKGGIAIVEPYWWPGAKWWHRLLAKTGYKVSEWMYHLWLKLGYPPEAARGFLTLDTATKVVYTYTLAEWKHIFDLRLYGKTGKPHPDAKATVQQIAIAIESAAEELKRKAKYTPAKINYNVDYVK